MHLFPSIPQRLQNLIQPFHQGDNDGGTRGSYAGWMTHHAIREALARRDTDTLAFIADFFQRGGPLGELERRAASVLRPLPSFLYERQRALCRGKRPDPSANLPLQLRLFAAMSPLGSWRLHRWSRLAESDDPLRFSKMAELTDWRFRIEGEVTGKQWLRHAAQDTAYLKDPSTRRIVSRIEREAPDLVDEAKSAGRYEKTQDILNQVLAGHPRDGRFSVPLVTAALNVLGDNHSLVAVQHIEKGAYDLFMGTHGEFERGVRARYEREGYKRFVDPATQNAVYFGRSVNGGAELYARERSLQLPWNLEPKDILFESLAVLIHEDRHHVDLEASAGRRCSEGAFPLELRAHGAEFLWRGLHGDEAWLRRFTRNSCLGFALGFRDYFEEFYRPVH